MLRNLYTIVVSETYEDGTTIDIEPYPILLLADDWYHVAEYIAENADEVFYENEATVYHLGNDFYWLGHQREYLSLGGHEVEL